MCYYEIEGDVDCEVVMSFWEDRLTRLDRFNLLRGIGLSILKSWRYSTAYWLELPHELHQKNSGLFKDVYDALPYEIEALCH